jgi:hypothetical protein
MDIQRAVIILHKLPALYVQGEDNSKTKEGGSFLMPEVEVPQNKKSDLDLKGYSFEQWQAFGMMLKDVRNQIMYDYVHKANAKDRSKIKHSLKGIETLMDLLDDSLYRNFPQVPNSALSKVFYGARTRMTNAVRLDSSTQADQMANQLLESGMTPAKVLQSMEQWDKSNDMPLGTKVLRYMVNKSFRHYNERTFRL